MYIYVYVYIYMYIYIHIYIYIYIYLPSFRISSLHHDIRELSFTVSFKQEIVPRLSMSFVAHVNMTLRYWLDGKGVDLWHNSSIEKCIYYPIDRMDKLSTPSMIPDLRSPWINPSGTTRSRQYHESNMVWRNLHWRSWWLLLLWKAV